MFECLVLVPSSSVPKPAKNSIISSQLVYIYIQIRKLNAGYRYVSLYPILFTRNCHTNLFFALPICTCMLNHFSCVQLFGTPWTVQPARLLCPQDSLGKNNWIGLPFPPPWDLPNPGTEPTSLMSQALAGVFFTTSTTWEANCFYIYMDFPGSSAGKESACNAGDLSSFLGGKILWIRDRLPTPVFLGFPGGSDSQESVCNVGDVGSIPELGRSSGEGNGNLHLQSFWENPHRQRTLAGYSS